MNNSDPKEPTATPESPAETTLPVPEVGHVPEADLDDVAGGMRADCTGCTTTKIGII